MKMLPTRQCSIKWWLALSALINLRVFWGAERRFFIAQNKVKINTQTSHIVVYMWCAPHYNKS